MNYSKAFGMCGAVLVTAASIIITAAPIHARSPEPVTVLGHRSDIVTRHVSYNESSPQADEWQQRTRRYLSAHDTQGR